MLVSFLGTAFLWTCSFCALLAELNGNAVPGEKPRTHLIPMGALIYGDSLLSSAGELAGSAGAEL